MQQNMHCDAHVTQYGINDVLCMSTSVVRHDQWYDYGIVYAQTFLYQAKHYYAHAINIPVVGNPLCQLYVYLDLYVVAGHQSPHAYTNTAGHIRTISKQL